MSVKKKKDTQSERGELGSLYLGGKLAMGDRRSRGVCCRNDAPLGEGLAVSVDCPQPLRGSPSIDSI